ncbi:MAG: glycosyltransferase N-terminal domain-containing protein [Gemmatimonadota bacterium]
MRPSLLYRASLALSRPLLPIAALFSPKLRRGHAGKAKSLARIEAWGRSERDPRRPLVWFHAPSVGEGLQARSVVSRLRIRHPEWQIVYTYFSPSAEDFAKTVDADLVDYLPYDSMGAARGLLDSLRPAALVFTKLDLWPELATAAFRRGVKVALIAGTVRPHSSRLGWPARQVLRPGYQALSAAAAIAEADASRLAILGTNPSSISVLGDPRFDSVLDVVKAIPPDDPLRRFGGGAPTMVAGSTWPGDESVLLSAFARLHVHRPDARLILVPHEPTTDHLNGLDQMASRIGLPAPVRLSLARGPVPLMVVDQMGILARLYGAGTMAYVGGGFHGAGLHSVLEPAAWGIPVAFGPRWQESRDASLLLEAGGGEAVAEFGATEAAETLQTLWEDWIVNEVRRAAQGRKALGVVQREAGAADRCADLLESLVEAGNPATAQSN